MCDIKLPPLRDLGLLAGSGESAWMGNHGPLTSRMGLRERHGDGFMQGLCDSAMMGNLRPPHVRFGLRERNGDGFAPLTSLMKAAQMLPPLSLGPSIVATPGAAERQSLLVQSPYRDCRLPEPQVIKQSPKNERCIRLSECLRGMPEELKEALPREFHDGMVVMKRRRTRKYKNAKPSRFCHLCARKKPIRAVVCSNIATSTCLKVTCQSCFQDPKLTFEEAMQLEAGWTCTHCRGVCPQRALCNSYDRANRKRNLENHIRKFQTQKRNMTSSESSSPMS
mmetsp:Transcript_638/g.1305  ORF Transcript_638/g.1305 Transcript_638/m.1305 type:complete len:280 (-) Transcript_638:151-990(-)